MYLVPNKNVSYVRTKIYRLEKQIDHAFLHMREWEKNNKPLCSSTNPVFAQFQKKYDNHAYTYVTVLCGRLDLPEYNHLLLKLNDLKTVYEESLKVFEVE